MTGEELFAMKWFEKEEAKRPSNKLKKANQLWLEGRNLNDVCRLTDLWTRVPYNLRFLRRIDWFEVGKELYRIDSFDWYDQMIVHDKDGSILKKDIYDRRGNFFSLAEIIE